jgi:surface-anchored protein
MKNKLILIVGVLMTGVMATQAKIILTDVHAEVGVNFDGTNFVWALNDETNEVEYEPEEAILFVEAATKATVPMNPNYAFLGKPGSTVWILPQVINPNVLTMGISAEDLPAGLFVNDLIDLHITSVKGPGQFALYEVNAFGTPDVFVNTRDGLHADDHVPFFTGGHAHFNWAFSKPGRYQVTFNASGTLVDGYQVVTSSPQVYTFHVSPHK